LGVILAHTRIIGLVITSAYIYQWGVESDSKSKIAVEAKPAEITLQVLL